MNADLTEEAIDGEFVGWEAFTVPGWDGQGAVAVPPERIAQAKGIIRDVGSLPDVGPGADGSVCMEWSDLWVDVEADGSVTRYVPLRAQSS